MKFRRKNDLIDTKTLKPRYSFQINIGKGWAWPYSKGKMCVYSTIEERDTNMSHVQNEARIKGLYGKQPKDQNKIQLNGE